MPQSSEDRSSENGVFQAELSGQEATARAPIRPQRSPAARIVLLLIFLVSVAAPVVWFWMPSEQAKWRVAAAQAKWLEDDQAAALQILDVAAAEFPDASAVYEQRLQFLIDTEQYEKALSDAERLVELSPKSPNALGWKSQVLHHLGRHEDAVVVCEQVLRLAEQEWIGSAAFARNSLAYAHAIGDLDLEVARTHIDEAIRLRGDEAALLDTRAFVLYRQREFKAARQDIEQAVEAYEKTLAGMEAYEKSRVPSFGVQQQRSLVEHSLAVMLYHRSLIYDRMGMRQEAKFDQERIRNLGYEPNENLF